MNVDLFVRIERHLSQLAPHVANRESALLLSAARGEILALSAKLSAMRQCFIDNTLRTTPSAKCIDLGKQIDDAVGRVIKNMNKTPNTVVSGGGTPSA